MTASRPHLLLGLHRVIPPAPLFLPCHPRSHLAQLRPVPAPARRPTMSPSRAFSAVRAAAVRSGPLAHSRPPPPVIHLVSRPTDTVSRRSFASTRANKASEVGPNLLGNGPGVCELLNLYLYYERPLMFRGWQLLSPVEVLRLPHSHLPHPPPLRLPPLPTPLTPPKTSPGRSTCRPNSSRSPFPWTRSRPTRACSRPSTIWRVWYARRLGSICKPARCLAFPNCPSLPLFAGCFLIRADGVVSG